MSPSPPHALHQGPEKDSLTQVPLTAVCRGPCWIYPIPPMRWEAAHGPGQVLYNLSAPLSPGAAPGEAQLIPNSSGGPGTTPNRHSRG